MAENTTDGRHEDTPPVTSGEARVHVDPHGVKTEYRYTDAREDGKK